METISQKQVAIYGAGGFAREVAWLIKTMKEYDLYDVVGFIDDGVQEGHVLEGKTVLSWERFRDCFPESMVTISIADPQFRKKLAAKCVEAGFHFPTIMHQSVQMSDSVTIGKGSILCSGSILTVNILIEQHVHINLNCTVGHDVCVGEFTTVSPGVHISGNVHIGKLVYIGTGATIINGTQAKPLTIGDGTVIGAGACITKSTEPNCLYAGVPAVLKKRYH